MSGDVVIDFATLQTLDDALKRILVEFDKAVTRSDALETAVGAPYGNTRLRDRVDEFERGWDIRRDDLKEGLLNIQERVQQTLEEWETLDKDMSCPAE